MQDVAVVVEVLGVGAEVHEGVGALGAGGLKGKLELSFSQLLRVVACEHEHVAQHVLHLLEFARRIVVGLDGELEGRSCDPGHVEVAPLKGRDQGDEPLALGGVADCFCSQAIVVLDALGKAAVQLGLSAQELFALHLVHRRELQVRRNAGLDVVVEGQGVAGALGGSC